MKFMRRSISPWRRQTKECNSYPIAVLQTMVSSDDFIVTVRLTFQFDKAFDGWFERASEQFGG